ncbi:MAG: sigma-E processing peptidase SpoIIGA [Christensenellaceae bacterium]|jgi:stage II sporulation protein GA (sporulation sigma-E factor processing peptidase)|nr:sigma-E processing peptidase SpoIIGA [Christensenellaceae bacterium]
MYIEWFLLDNALMDFLILRLATAFYGQKPCIRRLCAFACLGALYAVCAALWPFLGSLPCKLLFGGVMALALRPAGGRAYLSALLCVLAAAFLAGGMAMCVALAAGGKVRGGILFTGLPLRAMLFIALAAYCLPRLTRRILHRRAAGQVRLHIAQGGATYVLEAMIDSGNSLYDPVSGLPVIVAHLPALLPLANIPIPAHTIGGSGLMYALRPEHILLAGAELPALLAISITPIIGAQALIPPAALPAASIGE